MRSAAAAAAAAWAPQIPVVDIGSAVCVTWLGTGAACEFDISCMGFRINNIALDFFGTLIAFFTFHMQL
jgi:hypothetical protein